MKKFSLLLTFLLSVTLLSAQLIPAQPMDDYGHSERGLFTTSVMQADASNTKSNTDWVSLGPDGGDVIDIAVDPLNTSRMFAAAGIPYISDDTGENWVILDELHNMASGKITSFEMNGEGVVLAGGLYNYGKLFRSTDEGENWSSISFPLSTAYILDATFDPSDNDIAYLALAANGTSSKILLKSIDAGASWTIIDLINVMPNGWSLVNIIVDPNNNQNLYAIGNESFSNAMVIASYDQGDTWEDISGNLPTGKPYNTLAAASGILYLAGGQLFGGQTLGVYKTEDNGGSWQNISASFPNKVSNYVLIDPNNSEIMYVATEGDGIYYTNDGGVSWNFDGAGAGENGSARFLAFEPGNSQMIYAGFLSLAVCKSTDAALNWEYANKGIATLLLDDIEVNTNDPDKMLVGFEGENSGGCYMSNDGGESWDLVTTLPSTRFSQVTFGSDGSMYAWSNGPTTVAAEGLYKSTDGGASWANTGPHMGSSFETQMFSLCASKTNPDLLFIGGNNFGSFGWDGMIYRTEDGGDSWENVFQAPENDSFKYLSIDPNSGDEIVYTAYKSDAQGGFMKSPDGGSSWLPISNGIPSSVFWCSAITVDPFNSEILYGGAGGYGGGIGKMYISENSGGQWTYANLTLDHNYSKFTDIMVSPDNNKVIYAATTLSGVFMSDDSSASWNPMNDMLPAINITGFSNPFMKDDVWKLCASTYTNSAFISDIFIPSPVGIESNNLQNQNISVFPNPSNGSFSIKTEGKVQGPAELCIINKQGKTIYRLASNINSNGLLSIDIDIPAGLYFLKMNIEGRSYTEKLMIQ